MTQYSPRLRKYFRWEVLIPLLVLLAVVSYDLKNQHAFRVIVHGNSMTPTFATSENVWATSFYSRIVTDDIIVLKSPGGVLIKRVKYLPGNTFWVAQFDQIHWTVIPDDIVKDIQNINYFPVKKITVPKGYCWVEGDNLSDSDDSRIYGLLPISDILGIIVPWRNNKNTESNPANIVIDRIYQLKQKGIPINKAQFTNYESKSILPNF